MAKYLFLGSYTAEGAKGVLLSLMVNASGLASAKTVVLIAPEEMDQATKKTVKYRAPGK
jgi:hypothetical protein